MKIVTVFLLSCLLLLPSLAMAGGGGGGGGNVDPDQIGIYLDDAGEVFCSEEASGFTNVYLVLTNLSSPSIAGWEAKVTFTGGGLMTGFAFRGLAINASTRPNEYMVGLGVPLVADQGTICVMDLTLYVYDTTIPTLGFVGPIYYNSLEGVELPAYLDGADVELVKPLYPLLGTIDEAVLILNDACSGPVENTPSSWGDLKSLYR